jgi:hypothetical protein
MANRKLKTTEQVNESFLVRVREFAGAIHGYGVEKLYRELGLKGYTAGSYCFETFKTDFKRMKQSGNGFFNTPALIGVILEIIGFPAYGLFGGPISTAEADMKKIARLTISEMQKEKTPKKRIIHAHVINHAQSIYFFIQNSLLAWCRHKDNFSPNEPTLTLFNYYSLIDKTWHVPQELRIYGLLKIILDSENTLNIIASMNGQNLSDQPPSYMIKKESYIRWNIFLIIAYQLYAIEKMYALHRTGKKIRVKTPKNQQKIHHESEIYDSSNNPGSFENELNQCITKFDAVVKILDNEKDKIKSVNKEHLIKIIEIFQTIILFLLNPCYVQPEASDLSSKSMVDAFLGNQIEIKIHYVLEINEKETAVLRETNQMLNHLFDSPTIQSGIKEIMDNKENDTQSPKQSYQDHPVVKAMANLDKEKNDNPVTKIGIGTSPKKPEQKPSIDKFLAELSKKEYNYQFPKLNPFQEQKQSKPDEMWPSSPIDLAEQEKMMDEEI